MKVDCGYTENYFKEKNRMIKNCVIACEDCPISNDNNKTDLPCEVFERTCPDKAIEIVQKWSDEHQPETRLEHFKKMFPKAEMSSSERPKACVKHLNGEFECKISKVSCTFCWNEPYNGEF